MPRRKRPDSHPKPSLPGAARIRIAVVDDHPVLRRGIRALVAWHRDLELVGDCANTDEAYPFCASLGADLVIVDISLQGWRGLDLIRELHEHDRDLPILALSIHDEHLYAERALRAGARGYVMKQESAETLVRAIRRMHVGEIHLSERMTARMLEKVSGSGRIAHAGPLDPLSDRELEVFLLIGNGIGSRDIAQRLGLSTKTVEAHRAHIKAKLGLRNGVELVRMAVRWVEMGGIPAHVGGKGGSGSVGQSPKNG